MNKRNIINISLLAFILIAAGLAALDSSNDNENKKVAITPLKQADIVNITIKRLDKKDIYIEKKHNKWRLISPYQTSTNQFRMDTLLRLVETLPQSTYPLKETAPYGLDKPSLEVIFNSGETNSVSIKFGRSDPLKMRRYIAVKDKLHLANDTYFYALNSVATDYINHKLLDDDFKIIRLDLPKLKLKIIDDRWQATPSPKDFSVDSVNELINEWKHAQAINIDPIKTKIRFSSANTISLYSKDATKLTFHILNNDKEFILVNKLKGLQYSFPKEKEKTLLNLIALPTESEPESPNTERTQSLQK